MLPLSLIILQAWADPAKRARIETLALLLKSGEKKRSGTCLIALT